MKRMAWHWTLGVSAMALAFAACTVTSTDDDDDAGAGGATGGSGGETGGTGGATGGSAGAATGGSAGEGGSAGAATGGSAGAATGGSAGEGGSGVTCDNAFGDPTPTDSCTLCLIDECCAEVEACVNEPEPYQCTTSFACFADCTDPATYDDCKAACDEGNFNVNYNGIVACLETNCIADCQ